MAFRFALPLFGAATAAALALSYPAAAEPARVSKDVGPSSAACDSLAKGTAELAARAADGAWRGGSRSLAGGRFRSLAASQQATHCGRSQSQLSCNAEA